MMQSDELIGENDSPRSQTDAPSMGVISVVAAAADTPAAELPPLYEVVDPDALDKLINAGIARLSFSYAGYTIEINKQGEITANPT